MGCVFLKTALTIRLLALILLPRFDSLLAPAPLLLRLGVGGAELPALPEPSRSGEGLKEFGYKGDPNDFVQNVGLEGS